MYNPDSPRLEHNSRLSQMADLSILGANTSSFTALSSVAVDELYALERAEAMRRAEYEIRHTEALRRAEYEARHAEILSIHGRLSKSASTTPMMTPFYPSHHAEDGGYFGISREREVDYHPSMPRLDDDDASASQQRRHARRLSASAPRRDYAPSHSHSTGHVVDTRVSHHPHPHSHTQGHLAWAHPYHHPSHSQRHHLNAGHDDCPSPVSSDSDSLLPTHSPTRATAVRAPVAHAGHALPEHPVPGMHVHRTPAGDVAFTPSTSPFLGGMRKLNIHSAIPSRATSPFQLPPPGMDDEFIPSQSPPFGKLGSRKRNSTGDLVSLTHYSTGAGLYQQYSSERGSGYLPTPQLSSGPSSSGSSPRSHAYSLQSNSLGGGPSIVGSGSVSASSSRAPSPPLWAQQQKSQLTSPRHREHPHHHHIAHSVRAAFGMTPIHPRARPVSSGFSQLGARPHSDGSTPLHASHYGGEYSEAASLPGSRAPSPPIKLPPLKLPSSPSSPTHRHATAATVKSLLNDVKEEPRSADERVELPHFNEVEAATRLR